MAAQIAERGKAQASRVPGDEALEELKAMLISFCCIAHKYGVKEVFYANRMS